jgi:hypothetical protein
LGLALNEDRPRLVEPFGEEVNLDSGDAKALPDLIAHGLEKVRNKAFKKVAFLVVSPVVWKVKEKVTTSDGRLFHNTSFLMVGVYTKHLCRVGQIRQHITQSMLRLTPRITCWYGAQRNTSQVQPIVRQTS